jgi:DNA-binding NtrC family response regulator
MIQNFEQKGLPATPGDENPDTEGKAGIHPSLLIERKVLVVDEEGQRRQETVEIVRKVLPHAKIAVSNSPEEAETEMRKKEYDTYVVNLLMPGYSSSEFVKAVHNHPRHPLIVGFSADKMSDAYDPKKGIKIKPLRKLFEFNSQSNKRQGGNANGEQVGW